MTRAQGGGADGEQMLEYLRHHWDDEARTETVRLNALHTWMLVHKLLGHPIADIWPPQHDE